MTRTIASAFLACLFATHALAADIMSLWDFGDPAVSEKRFRSALATATGDDALILQTQIARTHMLRKDFERARDILRPLEPRIASAGAEAQVRYWLELGRSYASHQHPADAQTPHTRETARAAFTKALDIATAARLDGLAVDALHMFAFVDTAPAEQMTWNRKALARVEASDQPEAKRWEASLRSNLGEALYDLGRYDEALTQFERAATLREQGGNARATRDAHWHVARTLRRLDRIDEALAMQRRLQRESEAADEPRHYIYEELALLHEAQGDPQRAAQYAERARRMKK